jgi:hypothetical protein
VLAGGKVDAAVFAADVFMNAAADSIQYHNAQSRAEKVRDEMSRAEMEAAMARQTAAANAARQSAASDDQSVVGAGRRLLFAGNPQEAGMMDSVIDFFTTDNEERIDRIFNGGVNTALSHYFENVLDGGDRTKLPMAEAFIALNDLQAPDQMRGFMKALADIGINNSNYRESAAYLVLDGMTESAVYADLRERFGPGFQQQLDASPEVQEFLTDRIAGAKPGQLINISDFWRSTVQDAVLRAYRDPGAGLFRDAVDNGGLWQGTVPGLSKLWGRVNLNAIMANDELAPPALRGYASRSNATELVTTVGSAFIPFKAAFARFGTAGSIEGRVGFNALKETLIGVALNSSRGIKGTTFESLFFERFAKLGFKKYGEGMTLTQQKISVRLANGRRVNFIPEMVRLENGVLMRGVTELKAHDVVSLTPQIAGEAAHAAKLRVPYNLVVGPNAQVYQSVIDLARRSNGGVFVFNPATGGLTRFTH